MSLRPNAPLLPFPRGVCVSRRLRGTAVAVETAPARDAGRAEEAKMLWTIVVILAVMWLLGMVSSYSAGGLIHLLLVLAVIVVLFNLIQGRRAF